jgi:phage shock protein C
MEGMKGKLYRSRKDAMLAGVCGGLGEYFGIDTNLVRLVFILLAIANGVGVLIYFALWLIVPRAESVVTARETIQIGAEEIAEKARSIGEDMRAASRHGRTEAGILLGVALVVLGVIFLLRNLGVVWLHWLGFDVLWPSLLVIAGAVFLWRWFRVD